MEISEFFIYKSTYFCIKNIFHISFHFRGLVVKALSSEVRGSEFNATSWIWLPVGVSQKDRSLIDNSSVETEEAILGK